MRFIIKTPDTVSPPCCLKISFTLQASAAFNVLWDKLRSCSFNKYIHDGKPALFPEMPSRPEIHCRVRIFFCKNFLQKNSLRCYVKMADSVGQQAGGEVELLPLDEGSLSLVRR